MKIINVKDIIAVIDSTTMYDVNREFITERLMNNKLIGNEDNSTIIILQNKSYMVNKSIKYIKKKINNSLFIRIQEAI